MSSELPQKEEEKEKEEEMECTKCSFIRGDKKDYSKHLMTAKSIKMVHVNNGRASLN